MKISFCFVLVFCCVAIVTAQERVIDKSEFDAVVTDSNKTLVRLRNEKYRMTVTTSGKIIGRPKNDWSSKTISEYVSADQTRSIYSSMLGGKENPTKEAIVIGKWRYTRTGTDSWSRKAYEPGQTQAQQAPPYESPFEVIGTVADYKYLGKENLAGRSADVYQRIERQTKVNKKNGENTETETKLTYWVGEDRTLWKSEHRFDSRGATQTTQNMVILEWMSDPSLVITEPVLTPANP
jgi:hypothetical protein